MRTIIDLPDDQLESLSLLCDREQISRAEAIRRAVDCYLASLEDAETELADTFGIWKHKKLDAGFPRRLRKAWS